MNLGALIIFSSIIALTISFAFIIKIVSLEDKITNIKSKLYDLEKKLEKKIKEPDNEK